MQLPPVGHRNHAPGRKSQPRFPERVKIPAFLARPLESAPQTSYPTCFDKAPGGSVASLRLPPPTSPQAVDCWQNPAVCPRVGTAICLAEHCLAQPGNPAVPEFVRPGAEQNNPNRDAENS